MGRQRIAPATHKDTAHPKNALTPDCPVLSRGPSWDSRNRDPDNKAGIDRDRAEALIREGVYTIIIRRSPQASNAKLARENYKLP